MKTQQIFTVLLSVLLLIMLSSCETRDNNDADIWDGTIATSYHKGDGTKENPYQIVTAAQLALLAKEVNEGKTYANTFFSLLCDMNLNHLEWTPIGNGTYDFSGTFEGNNHVIQNLKISNGIKFVNEYPQGGYREYAAGLFGTCADVVIKDLRFDNAEILVQNTSDCHQIYAGVLVGTVCVNTSSEISGVKISNSRITTDYTQKTRITNLLVGGVGGHMTSDFNALQAKVKINRLHADIQISIENGYGVNSSNYVGGLWGNLSIYSSCDVKDCSTYLTVEIDPEGCYLMKNYFGAFGATTTMNDIFSLKNIFSKVSINKLYDTFHGYPSYTANAIAGASSHGKQKDGTVLGGYKLENLFGFVQQIDEATESKQITKQLYDMPSHAIYTETNCQGCETLPDEHELDLNIWDLDDKTTPKVK